VLNLSAEKQIVDYWLNSKGFFTITNLKAGNKDVGILALKFSEGSVKEVWHVEVNCSITSSVSDADTKKLVANFTDNYFSNSSIVSAINRYIKLHIGSEYTYRKVLVIGSIPKSRKDEIVQGFTSEGIQAIEFKEVLTDVMQKLETQYYKNDTIRCLQLIKYLLLSEPEAVVTLLSNESDMLTKYNVSKFVKTLMNQDKLRKSFAKSATDKELITMLKTSTLRQPEKLAKIASDVLGKKSAKKFLTSLLSQEKMHKTLPKPFTADYLKSTIERRQKPLKYYLKKIKA